MPKSDELMNNQETVCGREAERSIARYGWALLPCEELQRRALVNLQEGRARDERSAVVGAYCEALFAACVGAEGAARQSLAYSELGRYLYVAARSTWSDVPPDLYDDIVQDALLRIHRSIGQCRQPITFFSFAAYRLLDAARAVKRAHRVAEGVAALHVGGSEHIVETVVDEQPTPEERILSDERRTAILQLLAEYEQLHPRAATRLLILRRSEIEGLDDGTIARELATTVAAVQTARSRIKSDLRRNKAIYDRAHALGLLDN